MIRVLDLFSGIGGISLGLERTGRFRTVGMCEIVPYRRAVLRAHWRSVPIYDDVALVRKGLPGTDADMVCGGFPCQDISLAGKGEGIDGERSGLWAEMRRIVEELRPRWVLVENVPPLRVRGADRVLDELEALSYTTFPMVVGARHLGAPHNRDRVWIVALLADAAEEGLAERLGEPWPAQLALETAQRAGLSGTWPARPGQQPHTWEEPRLLESSMGGAVHGLSEELARSARRAAIEALGDSVVPQVVSAIGLIIAKIDECLTTTTNR